ncbi:MAG: shikimate kinase [Bacteroidota bacterium]|nr:shikimate kinase [Bacteroidota bacterium]
MRLFIVGFMGAGKTTIGRSLAKKLKYKFVDLDELFEDKFHFSIANFFDRFGEDKFREFEHQLLKQTIIEHDDLIISTGGGTPCFYDNMDIMNKNGLTLYIRMHEHSLKHRLLRSRRRRPVLPGLREDEMEAFINKLMEYREPIYQRANFTVKGEDLDIDEIVSLIQTEVSGI